MKAISHAIDRFCQKHRGFGVPRLMLYIVATSAVAFILGGAGTGLFDILTFNVDAILRGQVWRLITWIFMPVNSNIIWVAISLYFYYFVGSTLEREWGAGKFTIFYIFGVLLNIIYGFCMRYIFDFNFPLSPMYINLSMFFAFATLYPDVQIRLSLIIPIKVKWLALVNAAMFLMNIIHGFVIGSIFIALLPIVAILNYFLMCGYELLQYLRPFKPAIHRRL